LFHLITCFNSRSMKKVK